MISGAPPLGGVAAMGPMRANIIDVSELFQNNAKESGIVV
jgi:hypothetical protein